MKTNLSNFRTATAGKPPAESPAPAEAKPAKTRYKGVTLRLTPEQWRRAHELAVNDETSINALAIAGISKILQERGLPPL